MARSFEVSAQYDFVIEHRKGSKHNNFDSLSRNDFEQETSKHDAINSGDCTICQQASQEWANSTEEVENVVDLGIKVNCLKAEVPCDEKICLRAFTRTQAKALTGSEKTRYATMEVQNQLQTSPQRLCSYLDIPLRRCSDSVKIWISA